ncbi:MAG: DHH family phosphoesterase [Deltaproteobacteria bacterium]|nr:DHH family phosphoesterase [Deltaproteobacteria bacterium]
MGYFDDRLLIGAREFIDTHLSATAEHPSPAIALAYHGDGDGCCAAYFLHSYINRPVMFYWVPTPDFDFVKLEEHMVTHRPALAIFLDMPVCNRPDMIEKISSRSATLIFDHHQVGGRDYWKGRRNVLYINPVLHQKGQAFPTVLFGWELLTHRTSFDKEVLFMGLFTETWLDHVPLSHDYDPAEVAGLKEIAKRIHANFLIQDMSTTHYALDFLFEASRQGSVRGEGSLNSRQYQILDNVYHLVQNEKSWLTRGLSAELRRLINPKFILKRIESKMRLSGLVASELRWKYPHLIIGIWQRWKGRYLCELRRGKGCSVNLADLVERIKGETPLLTGGGHPMAAAFTAEGDDFFKALNRLRHYISRKHLPESG